MPHNEPRVATDAKDAAKILRGYKKRIERLEEDQLTQENVQLYRQASDSVVCNDTLSTSTGSAGAFEWNTSSWGFDEWEDN